MTFFSFLVVFAAVFLSTASAIVACAILFRWEWLWTALDRFFDGPGQEFHLSIPSRRPTEECTARRCLRCLKTFWSRIDIPSDQWEMCPNCAQRADERERMLDEMLKEGPR